MTTSGASSRQPLYIGKRRVDRGYTRFLKDGTIVFEWLPPRVLGKKKPSYEKLNVSTATDAQREIERLLPISRQSNIGDRSIRLQPLYQDALAAMRAGEYTHSMGVYSERSIELFRQRAEDHVLRLLDPGMKVADVKAAHLRKLMKRLEAEGLGGSTVRGCLSCASVILRYAVEQEIIEYNPANLIGRGERPSAKRKTEPRYLTIPEVQRLLSKMSDDTRPVAVAMFWGALRVSEALELRWSDLGEGTLLVRGTKTKASADSIPLLPQLVAELEAHRRRMSQRGLQFIARDALVFQTRSGKPVGRRNVLRAVQNAAVAAGLVEEGQQPVGCHDLRHSMLANALALPEMNMTKVSRLARHANTQVTATVYAGLTDDGLKGLSDALAGLG